jgi:hypothetical protein
MTRLVRKVKVKVQSIPLQLQFVVSRVSIMYSNNLHHGNCPLVSTIPSLNNVQLALEFQFNNSIPESCVQFRRLGDKQIMSLSL